MQACPHPIFTVPAAGMQHAPCAVHMHHYLRQGIIADTVPCCRYRPWCCREVDRLVPSPPLTPDAPAARKRMEDLLQQTSGIVSAGEIHKPLLNCWCHRSQLSGTLGRRLKHSHMGAAVRMTHVTTPPSECSTLEVRVPGPCHLARGDMRTAARRM